MSEPFERVVEDHGAVVLRVCRALLGPDDADDAWSETFLAAMRAYPDLRPDSNVRGWLVTIAHRKAVDVLRRNARAATTVREVRDAAGPDLAIADLAHSAGIDGRGGGAVGDDDLASALGLLSPKQRDAVVHHYLADLPYREVAEVMGISVDAARRNAADGIAALRARYRKGAC